MTVFSGVASVLILTCGLGPVRTGHIDIEFELIQSASGPSLRCHRHRPWSDDKIRPISDRLHGAIISSDQEDPWSFANRAIRALLWAGP